MKRVVVVALALGCASAPQQKEAPPAQQMQAQQAPAQPPAPAAPDLGFRAQPPGPGGPVVFQAPTPKQLALKNGLKVFLLERHEVPLVTVDLAIDSGVDTNPQGKAGLASFALDLLDEGTKTRDAAAIARTFENLAARYRATPDADASHVTVTALAATLDDTLEVFADVVLNPAFRPADVERVRRQRLGQIAQQLDDPAAVGQNVLSRVLFGDRHPWAFPGEGTVASVKALKRSDVAAWHAGAFQPRNAALFVVGDTTEAALVPMLEKRFGGWKNGRQPAPAKHEPAKPKERVVYVVDKEDAPQSQIWVGEIGVSSTSPDVFAVRVMNSILGGTFNSRLNGNLRTEHAYSYGAFSFFDTHRQAGPFIATGGVVADKTAEALSEFVKELDRMRTGEITDAELEDAKSALVQQIPALFASTEATAQAFARAWTHDLPLDYYAHYQERVQAVSRDDVAHAAQQRLHPDTMAIVVVGPIKSIEQKIAALHIGRVEIRDAEGVAAKAAAAAASTGK